MLDSRLDIAEVNNTFGDGHVYVLRNGRNDKQNVISYNTDKTFVGN